MWKERCSLSCSIIDTSCKPVIDVFCGREPNIICAQDVVKRAFEIFHSMWRPNNVGMHAHRHHAGLVSALRVQAIKLINDPSQPSRGFMMVSHHQWKISRLDGIRHRHHFPVRRLQRYRLVINGPIDYELEARVCQMIERVGCFVETGPEPTLGWLSGIV
jgi:hypothetical protein